MANVGPVLWFLRDNAPTSTIGWSAVAPWAALTAVAAGVLRRQLATPTVGNERVFACIIAGTTLAAEPTWTVTKGAKTAEAAGPTWQEVTGQPGVNGNTADSPTWLQNKNTALTLGLIIFDSVSASLQIVSTAGTTGNGVQPSFSATAGVTTADNTVTWTSLGLASGFAAWAAPHARLANATATPWLAAGNSIFVGDDHSETQSSAMTVASQGTAAAICSIYSIDHALALTLAAATLKTGASVATTGNSALNATLTFSYLIGLTLICGNGANSPSMTLFNVASTWGRLDNCVLQIGGTAGGNMNLGGSSAYMEMNNTTVQVAATASQVSLQAGLLRWNNTPSAIAGATLATTLFLLGRSGIFIMTGVDFSALGSGKTLVGASALSSEVQFVDCKLGASVTIAAAPTSQGLQIDAVSSDSAAANYIKYRNMYQGLLTTETVVVRTGGASNGVTAISDKIVTTANSTWLSPFNDIPIGDYNTVTGTNRVITLAGIWNAAAVPNNDDIFINVSYLGSSATPQASFATNTKASNLATGTGLTADSTSAWDSLVTARANTTAYSTGDVIKVASNPGRVFFCTSAGTSAGSEPGGYASAVDGGSVTDNTAVFRAGVRFTLTVTLSSPQPAMAGPIYVTVNAAKISSTFYVDPLVQLS